MRTWQPREIIYPDAELAICKATRLIMASFNVGFIGTQKPAQVTTAIIWNRVGGADPNAILQCRVFAPTHQQANDLARQLAARLPIVSRLPVPISAISQNEGPTDLGFTPGAMRQMMYELNLRGSQL